MGLDRLRLAALLLVAVLAAGCDRGVDRPERLLYGQAAPEFKPVAGSVVASSRVLDGTTLGARFTSCRPARAGIGADAVVVERIGVFGESLTFADPARKTLYACDGGTDPSGERKPPWCGGAAGLLFNGKLLDPRLDVLCRDRNGRPLAYAWVEPLAGVKWIGVDQGPYTEVYEVLARLPVRIVSGRGIQLGRSRATFDVTQYDGHGNELVKGKLEATVAG
ncbi:MAG: hypothetical protein QOE13_1610 [Gaiellaceae bacterium]|jgi:hypothetical protein|nr:hypothetical protein [Gaiellaceae bacterium]